MVTSPIIRKVKADTLGAIEHAAVAYNSGCGLPSGLTNLRVRYDKSLSIIILFSTQLQFIEI